MKKINKKRLNTLISEIANYDLENNKVFGSCYAVLQDGNVVYKNVFGYASISKKDLGYNTLFRLASMTKPITVIAVLILVERGLLSLDDEIADYIPAYKNVHITKIAEDKSIIDLGESKTAITIRHLLTHTSGIGSNSNKGELLTLEDKKTSLSVAKFYAKIGIDFEAGTKQAYSGVGAFAVLGYIIEKISGMTLQQFYKKEIFEPCEMRDTTFIPTQEQWLRVIDMHGRNESGNVTVTMKKDCAFMDYPCEHCVAGAGLFSTLDDYIKFAQMLLNRGKTPIKRIVKEDLIREMITPHVYIDEYTYWGYGVRVIQDNHPYLENGSFGWSGAYGSHFWVSPTENIVAVFMKNSTIDGGAGNASSRNFESAVKRSLE